MSERVVLAMSGGVDSSAAAALLQEAGYEVIGLFMRSGVAAPVCATGSDALPILETKPKPASKPHKQGCCSASDAADARFVADRLDIPFHALNFQDAFTRIKDYFADEYLAGRTPNPCVRCNNWLKFGRLWDFARQVGATKIATGHYARVATTEEGPRLLRGRDGSKDQSYVLFGLQRDLLDHVLFPVGDLTKAEIRAYARDVHLRTADKPDSQEICFVPDNDYAGFVRRYRGERDTAGELVDTAGTVLGRHAGYERFTIGQRRGLGMAFGTPRFVVRIEPETRRVVIGTKEELGRSDLQARQANWFFTPPAEFRCAAQIRYQHPPAPCTARLTSEDKSTFALTFDAPQFGVAPGQACVLYEEDRVLGGGWIE